MTPKTKNLFLFPALVAAFLTFAATPAMAAERWGAVGSLGVAPADPQPLSDPVGVAVNQSAGHMGSGDVYVVDKGNNRVERFSATGGYLGQFNGGGSFEVEGKAESGAAAPSGALHEPDGIAVDSDLGSPSFGDVYVIDQGHRVVDKFSATGAYVGQVAGTCPSAGTCPASKVTPFLELYGVAVDPSGVVWVESGEPEHVHPAIDSFTNEQINAFLATRVSQVEGFVRHGLAVDSEDNLYVVDNVVGTDVAKLNRAGEPVGEGEIGELHEVSGVAVDPVGNNLYVDSGLSVSVFSPSESLIESFGTGLLQNAGYLAVNPTVGASGYAYIVQPGAGEVLLLEHSVTSQQPPPPAASETGKVEDITATSAEFTGRLNPEEAEGGVGYYFSYHAGAGSGCTEPGSVSTPLDNGGSNLIGNTPVSVSATVSGLVPNTEYVFCLVAARFGVADGLQESSTTLAAAPAVISEDLSSVMAKEGEFSAVINPENEETTYRFEYSTEGSVSGNELGAGAQTAPGEPFPTLGPEFVNRNVAVGGVSLKPDTNTVYYRMVATNKAGTTYGHVQAYTKLPIVAGESFSALTSSSVKLEGTVNPDFAETTYSFEYATSKEALENGAGTQVPNGTGVLAPPASARCQDGTLPVLSAGESFTCDDESQPTCPNGSTPARDGGILQCAIPVIVEVASLQSGQTYYYRVVTENEITREAIRPNEEGKPVRGEIKEFTPYAAPSVTTGQEAQNITRTSATLTGTVDPKGAETTYSFQYISETAYQTALANHITDPYTEGETTVPISAGSGTAPVAAGPTQASGLQPGETYHYRLLATNRYGVQSIGGEATFTTTSATPPNVSTGAANGVSQNTATLYGTVTTNGLQTNYGFEIGTEPFQPGTHVPPTGLGSIGGALTEEVHVTLGELQPGTTYYYRITATNADGTEKGQPGTFTTPGFPTLIAPPASPAPFTFTKVAFPAETGTTGTGTKVLTRAQKLAVALKACHSKRGAKRTGCERTARKRFGPVKRVKQRK